MNEQVCIATAKNMCTNYLGTNVYQFRHICTSVRSADDGFGFTDPHFLFVFCNNYTTLIHFMFPRQLCDRQ